MLQTVESQVFGGGCFCKAVRYEITKFPKELMYCHCRTCRQFTGSLFASFSVAGFGFSITKNEGLKWFESSANAKRGFCGNCGTTLFFQGQNDFDGMFEVCCGSLDNDGETIEKTVHIFCSSAASYTKIADGAVQYPKYPPEADEESSKPITRPIKAEDLPILLDLNNALAVELSYQETQRFSELVDRAFCGLCSSIGGKQAAFVLTFDQDAEYDSVNFLWFKAHYQKFIYIDRVAVSEWARGRGLARQLYSAVFEASRAAGHELIVCEVNVDPPNPASDALHSSLGFKEVGKADLESSNKTVGYYAKYLS